MSEQNRTEEFSVNGDQVVEKVKQLIKEGNVRRVIIKNEKGESIMEFPVTAGVVGVLLLPNPRSTRRSSGIDGAVHDRSRAAGLAPIFTNNSLGSAAQPFSTKTLSINQPTVQPIKDYTMR